MKARVLFFGATAQAAGTREAEIDLPEATTAAAAFAQISGRFPALKQHSLLFAVNQEYANGDELIGDGDELAVFTPVSGG